jgi:alkanesulfonate monooxygenase SsuD/methylene tetrahydromethanopterin reductase-like flavin-dependent oxidoreductase (luciferase family)
MMRQAAIQAGRNLDEIRFIVFAGSVIGATEREALDRRRALDDLIDLRGPYWHAHIKCPLWVADTQRLLHKIIVRPELHTASRNSAIHIK